MSTEEQEYEKFVGEIFQKAGEVKEKFYALSENNRNRFVHQYLEPFFSAIEIQRFLNQFNQFFSQGR